MRIHIDISEADRDLQELIRRLDNPREAFQDVGDYMLLRTQERFDRQINPRGQAWHPLAEPTLRWKRRKGKILKILQRDGDLRRSISYRASKDKLKIGTNRIYGKYHQLARDSKKRREWSGIDEQDNKAIADKFEDFLSRGNLKS